MNDYFSNESLGYETKRDQYALLNYDSIVLADHDDKIINRDARKPIENQQRMHMKDKVNLKKSFLLKVPKKTPLKE